MAISPLKPILRHKWMLFIRSIYLKSDLLFYFYRVGILLGLTHMHLPTMAQLPFFGQFSL